MDTRIFSGLRMRIYLYDSQMTGDPFYFIFWWTDNKTYTSCWYSWFCMRGNHNQKSKPHFYAFSITLLGGIAIIPWWCQILLSTGLIEFMSLYRITTHGAICSPAPVAVNGITTSPTIYYCCWCCCCWFIESHGGGGGGSEVLVYTVWCGCDTSVSISKFPQIFMEPNGSKHMELTWPLLSHNGHWLDWLGIAPLGQLE